MQNVFVGNLSVAASEDSIRTLFEAHGSVGRVNIVTDHRTGQPLGFGFVEMPNDFEREEAITTVNGTNLNGCTLYVNQACPKADRWAGRHSEGVVLSVCGSLMRVAIRDCDDAAEFRFRGGQWFAEDGFPVKIAFLSPFGHEGFDRWVDADSPLAGAAVSVN